MGLLKLFHLSLDLGSLIIGLLNMLLLFLLNIFEFLLYFLTLLDRIRDAGHAARLIELLVILVLLLPPVGA